MVCLPFLVKRSFKVLSPILLSIALPNPHALAQCPPDLMFGPSTSYQIGRTPTCVITGDFNSDQVLDLAAGSSDDRSVFILLGQAGTSGGFTTSTVAYPTGTIINSILANDFNDDGIADLATGSWDGSGLISVLLGNGSSGVGTGTFRPAVQYTAVFTPSEVTAADFNGDGITDLASAGYNSSSNGAVAVLFGRGQNGVGDGTFGSPVILNVASTPFGITSADFNEDGITDIATANYDRGTVSVFQGLGTGGVGDGTFATPIDYSVGSGARHLIPADFNADGILDLAVAKLSDVAILTGLGVNGVGTGTFSGPTSHGVQSANPGNIVTSDLNRDGILDLIAGGAVLLGRSGGQFELPHSYSGGSVFDDVAVGDFNSDQGNDLAFVGYSTPTVRIALNTCLTPDLAVPQIVSVLDVPFDQGGLVKVSWSPSGYDGSAGGVVSNYWLWRSVPPNEARQAIEAGSARLMSPTDFKLASSPAHGRAIIVAGSYYWEFLTEKPAAGLPGYSYVSATTSDSIAAGNPMTAFLIQARSSDGGFTWNSPSDSGYSVDNLPPFPLQGIGGYYAPPATVVLHWSPSTDTDFSNYVIYRGDTPDFPIGRPYRLGATIDTIIPSPVFNAQAFFKVTAIDIHGNESEPVTLAPAQISGIEQFGAPRAVYLDQNRPNPFNPYTTIEFGTSEAGRVLLRIYDASGRLVRTVLDGQRTAGHHLATWDGTDDRGAPLPSGIYVAQLRSVEHVRVIKLALLR